MKSQHDRELGITPEDRAALDEFGAWAKSAAGGRPMTPTKPTPSELALNLAQHAANLEPLCQREGVNTLYGPRGWYSMGHHLAAVHRASYAEAEVARLTDLIQRTLHQEAGHAATP